MTEITFRKCYTCGKEFYVYDLEIYNWKYPKSLTKSTKWFCGHNCRQKFFFDLKEEEIKKAEEKERKQKEAYNERLAKMREKYEAKKRK